MGWGVGAGPSGSKAWWCGWGWLIQLPFLRLRKMKSNQCCLPKDSALVSKSILNNQINWETKFKIKTSRKRWGGSSGWGRGQGAGTGLGSQGPPAQKLTPGTVGLWEEPEEGGMFPVF